MSNYGKEAFRENQELDQPWSVEVYGDTVVKNFSNHIRINKNDWEKIKKSVINVMQNKGEKNANGSNENN